MEKQTALHTDGDKRDDEKKQKKKPAGRPRSGRGTGAGEKAERREWYQLDLSAIVYPTLQRRDFSSVYRLSVVLKEEIRPQILQQALDLTLPRFPTYKAAIRKGLFWRYLEPNDRPGPFVQEDVKNPSQSGGRDRRNVRASDTDGYLSETFRISRNRERRICAGYQ